jgi:Fe-S-cluster containining protein
MDRNAPCYCGSGKKFKKCHGLQAVPKQREPPLALEVNRRIAYLGEVGRRREAFVKAYLEMKRKLLPLISQKLAEEAQAADKSISCHRGCSHCCKLFVVGSLQECEAIAYYLYTHEPAMRLFLRNFPHWNDRILKIEASFRRMNALHARITSGEATKEEQDQFDVECDNYAAAGIPCPFLNSDACGIYEVRPFVCARLAAVTPSEWCRAGHPNQKEAVNLKAQIQFEQDMPYFEKVASACVFSSMPFLVWRILNDGYGALSTVPGLGDLKKKAYSDTEVQAALREMGAESE